MKIRRWLILSLMFIVVGCGKISSAEPTSTVVLTPTRGDVSVGTTSAPDPGMTARAFLDGWKSEDYAGMYNRLTSISQDALSFEDFEKQYRSIATEAALSGIDYEILSSLIISPQSGQVGYRVILHSSLVGDIERDTSMNLTRENGDWRIQWDDTLVIPELNGENYLAMERYIPSRGNIYDRDGSALVGQAEVTAIGIIPGQLDPEQSDALYGAIQRLLGLKAEDVQARFATYPAGSDWYLPLGEAPSSEVGKYYSVLSALAGFRMEYYKARYYYDGGVAPHLTGYVSTIHADEEEEYLRKGYRRDERVGQTGLEKWGEDYLSGKRGGALYVFDSQGQPVTRLAEVQPEPAQAIYTTIDRDFQQGVQQSIAGFRAAVVVLERDTGRVLAMASSPKFDPNAFEPSNINSNTQLSEIFNNTNQPWINRATQGLYPLGSVFKIVTLSAALESERFTVDSTYQCGYEFTELAGVTLYDWTYEHFLLDGVTIPSGLLTLPEGLIRSCDPWFWHIGLTLFDNGMTTAVSDMAEGFGLGKPTGIEGVDEETGQVPAPESQIDATNQAIGQGALQVTPLQVARFVAAVGNGGTLYQPQIIEKISSTDNVDTHVFKPIEDGTLPISEVTLTTLQEAMRGVIVSTKPFGTAWHRFTGLDIKVAGKTGTAESGSGKPHAWFAGYTFEEKPNKPDIAAVVIVENIGEGSDYAAPIFRRLVELYYYGLPGKLYPWESNYYITSTPTPIGFEGTPTAESILPPQPPQP
ncbi:MAG: hypothetical protein JW908_10195 [Anaerolineales bacterium]|nr:hypothetical protein [Anaerolineales bacterium]